MSRKKVENSEPLALEVRQALTWQFQQGYLAECETCQSIYNRKAGHLCVNRLPAVRQVTRNSTKNRVFGVRICQ